MAYRRRDLSAEVNVRGEQIGAAQDTAWALVLSWLNRYSCGVEARPEPLHLYEHEGLRFGEWELAGGTRVLLWHPPNAALLDSPTFEHLPFAVGMEGVRYSSTVWLLVGLGFEFEPRRWFYAVAEVPQVQWVVEAFMPMPIHLTDAKTAARASWYTANSHSQMLKTLLKVGVQRLADDAAARLR